MARLTLRIDLGELGSIGPGKVRLLECIVEKGSIRGAAAAMKMSYKRAWMLIQDLEQIFGGPVLETETGGKAGGGARLSRTGRAIVQTYRAAEAASVKASARALQSMERLAKRRG